MPNTSDVNVKTTIWLSTDGKNTVQVETQGDVDPNAALAIAEEIYAQIEETHGRKVDQWKDLDRPSKKPIQTTVSNPNAPICGVHDAIMIWRKGGISKAGKPYPGFWACPDRNEDGSYCTYRPPRAGE